MEQVIYIANVLAARKQGEVRESPLEIVGAQQSWRQAEWGGLPGFVFDAGSRSQASLPVLYPGKEGTHPYGLESADVRYSAAPNLLPYLLAIALLLVGRIRAIVVQDELPSDLLPQFC